jgi:hypothetical protein
MQPRGRRSEEDNRQENASRGGSHRSKIREKPDAVNRELTGP